MSRLSDTPPGQPKAYPRTKVDIADKDKERRELPKFVYPHDVINIRSKDQLESELKEHGHLFPSMPGSPTPKNKHALRYHFEWIRPTLRWFCKVYGIDMPSWLKGNSWGDEMGPRSQKKMVGPEPLRVVEWRENKRAGRST